MTEALRRPCMIMSLTLLAACSSYKVTTSLPPPAHVFAPTPAQVGQICVVRPHSVAALAPAVVHDNGRLVGVTKGPTYFCYLAQPGWHSLASTYGDDVDRELGTDQVAEATVMVEPARRYFLHHDVTNPLLLSVRWVSEAAARPMIDVCRYAQLAEVPGDEAIPEADRLVPAMATR